MVRAHKDTKTPNWNENGEKAGRIYNKTDDITVIPGRKAYNTSFKPYTPPSSGGGTGGSSGGGTQPVNNKITVSADSWTWDNDVKVFAWVWKNGKNSEGKWISCTKSGNDAQFELEPGKDRFLLVRAHKDTTTPDWKVNVDKAGRIYNKTGDITVKAGQTVYSAVFSGYTPSGGGSGGGTGGGSGGSTQPTVTHITVSTNSGAWGSNAKIFAWVWKGSSTGSWKKCTGSGSTVNFDIPADCDHFKLVRFSDTTTTPSWNPSSAIWNQSSEVTVVKGTTRYTAKFW